MLSSKKDIVKQLQKEILALQGFKSSAALNAIDFGLGFIEDSFPNGAFPIGAVHEFLCTEEEHAAATCGFISGLLASLMRGGKVSLWISNSRTLFPPALKAFGIEPDQVIFIDLKQKKDLLWAMEEALKCEGLAAVVGEIPDINFTDSRRLQLAVEQSRVTGFILRCKPRNVNTIACISRWRIVPIPGELADNLPGVGYPRWNVELLKIRNGKPGGWQLEWSPEGFRHIHKSIPSILQEPRRKTG